MRIKGVLGISAALLLGVTSCSEPTAAGEPDPTPPSTIAAQQTTWAPEPSRSPVAEYTSEQLSEIVSLVIDDSGYPLTEVPEADIWAAQKQRETLLPAMTVEPPQCAKFTSTDIAIPEGAAVALGMSEPTESGKTSILTLSIVPDMDAEQVKLDKFLASGACRDITVNIAAEISSTRISVLENATSLPEAYTFRADTTAGAGQMSLIMSSVIHKGVSISTAAIGGESEQDAVGRAADLMEQAAALIK
ncbi:hypothetical protein V1638_08495 [Pseudarthrobacter sp. J64]|uniref:hypothetical protein n=1 Tax=Pseudarthrobacter sp. J64 TaxID=3116485 RepID=UPI002E810BB3|nr:hypothetical protein [Pseudarthrobacter sp. J64]MEE2569438.1 hypothetical protein [Pseudarthrobacter sp. J64]